MRITVRLAVGLLALLPFAVQAEAPPPEAPVAHRVVGQALSATQAVLLDDETGEYRIVRVGDQVNGAHVVAIGDSDVVLVRGGSTETLTLAADSRPRARITLEPMVVRMRPAQATAVAATPPSPGLPPVVVTPSAVVAAPAVAAAPVAAPAPVVVAATPPPAPVANPAPAPSTPPVVVAAPVATPAPAQASNGAPKIVFVEPLVPPPAVAPASVSTPAPVSTAPVSPTSGVTTVPRAELDRGLGDFRTLDASVALEIAPEGGFRVANLVAGSFLEKLGLRRGDVIQRVDGRWLRNVDDASAAYNWVRVTDHFAVDLLREGHSTTLHVQITA